MVEETGPPAALSTKNEQQAGTKRPSQISVRPDSSWISEAPLRAGSKRSSEVAEISAMVRETENVSLRQLRLERQSWRVDRMELEHLRKLVDRDNPVSSDTQLKKLIREKAQHEEQLESFNEEILVLKEKVHSLQLENGELHRSAMKLRSKSDDAKRIQDLERQINKWETLYFESAEMGERQIEKLEHELEQTRDQLAAAERETAVMGSTTGKDSEGMVATRTEMETLKRRINQLEMEKESKDNEQNRSGYQSADLSERSDEHIDDYSTDGDDLEQYVAELERMLSTQQEEAIKAKTQLEKSHNVGKEMQSKLKEQRRQTQEAEEQLAASKKREADLMEKIESAEVTWQNRTNMLEYQLDEMMEKLGHEMGEGNAEGSDIRRDKYITDLQQELRVSCEELEETKAQVQILQEKLDQKVASPIQPPTKIESGEFKESLPSYLVGTPMEHCNDPFEVIEMQQKEFYECERKLRTALKENQQLRKLKDSLMGIDEEMEVLIDSLEPIQAELAEKKEKAESAMLEAASLRNLLNKEITLRHELEREKMTLAKELARVQESLDKVYMELKDEQASREEEIALMKIQAEGLKESLKHQMERYSELHEKMDEMNEQQQLMA